MMKFRSWHRVTLFAGACLVLAASVVSPASAQSLVSPETQAAYDKAEGLMTEEKYDEAIAAYTEAIQRDLAQADTFADAYRGRADAFVALEDYQSALEDYSAAIERNESLASAYNGRGKIYMKIPGGASEAQNDFKKAVSGDRNNAEYAANLGRAMVQVGYVQPALKVLNRSIDLDATNPEAFVARGQAFAMLLDFETAFADFDVAVGLDPTNHETYYALGILKMQAKEHRGAVDAFGLAMESYTPKQSYDPPYVDPYLGASLAYIELGKESATIEDKAAAYGAAIAECDKALEKVMETQSQRAIALFNRGIALRLLGNYGESIRMFSDAIQFNPEFSEAYFRRGIVWHAIGENGLAAGDFEQASAISFEDVRPYLWLGFAQMSQENYVEAIRSYGKAIHQDERFTPAHVNRGLAYIQLKDYDKAIHNFNEAIRLEPTESLHYYKRGAAEMMLGDYTAGSVSYSTAIAFNPNFVEAYHRLAECEEALGESGMASETRAQADSLQATPDAAAGEAADAGMAAPAPPEDLPAQ